MSKRSLPELRAFEGFDKLQSAPLPAALDKWSGGLRAASEEDNNVISILDVIGADPFTGGGVTAKRVSAALRAIGPKQPVTVHINSPGGLFFEGVAIYNMLREHPAEVTVKVLGMAASAASIIAMAGDRIEIAKSAFYMIHNTQVLAIGDRHLLDRASQDLEQFDSSMAGVYADRTGMEQKKIADMMDRESWINGSSAVDMGFADALLPPDAVKTDDKSAKVADRQVTMRKIDALLGAQFGLTRSERRQIFDDIRAGTQDAARTSGMRDAADDATQDAGATEIAAMLQQSIATLQN